MQIPNNSYNKKQYDEASRRHMRLHDAMGGLTATTENLIYITLGMPDQKFPKYRHFPN